jgi:hypothetical protein
VLYLAFVADQELDPGAEGPWEELFPLHPGVVLIDSSASRSAVYHAVKHELPPGSPLLVAPLASAPKFKGMVPGALAWVRDRV